MMKGESASSLVEDALYEDDSLKVNLGIVVGAVKLYIRTNMVSNFLRHTLFVIIFLFIFFQIQNPSATHNINASLVQAFIKTPFNHQNNTFESIQHIQHTWQWIENVFLTEAYRTKLYNGKQLPAFTSVDPASDNDDTRIWIRYQNRPNGPYRFRQIRTLNGYCRTPENHHEASRPCRGDIDKNAQIDPTSPGLLPYSHYVEGSNQLGIQLLSDLTGKSDRDYSSYGSHVVDLPLRGGLPFAQNRVAEMRANDWLDEHTAVFSVEIATYNPSEGSHTVLRMVIEYLPSGKVFPSYEVITMRLSPYANLLDRLRLACEVLLLLYIVWEIVLFIYTIWLRAASPASGWGSMEEISARERGEHTEIDGSTSLAVASSDSVDSSNKQGCSSKFCVVLLKRVFWEVVAWFSSFWNCVDFCALILLIYVVACWSSFIGTYANGSDETAEANAGGPRIELAEVAYGTGLRAFTAGTVELVSGAFSTGFRDYYTAGKVFQGTLIGASFAVLLVFLKLFRYSQLFSERLLLVWEVLFRAARQLLPFAGCFLVIALVFTFSAHMIMGYNIPDFYTIPLTFSNLLQSVVVGLQYQRLKEASPVSAPFFGFLWVLFVSLIMLNMFIAIIAEAYGFVRRRSLAIKRLELHMGGSITFSEIMKTSLPYVMSCCCCFDRSRVFESENDDLEALRTSTRRALLRKLPDFQLALSGLDEERVWQGLLKLVEGGRRQVTVRDLEDYCHVSPPFRARLLLKRLKEAQGVQMRDVMKIRHGRIENLDEEEDEIIDEEIQASASLDDGFYDAEARRQMSETRKLKRDLIRMQREAGELARHVGRLKRSRE